jgi:tetratricopeptide (TPR) repeat protein
VILILMFCFALASAGEAVPPAVSNPLWNELRHSANGAEKNGDLDAAERYYLQALQAAEDGGVPTGQFTVAEELGQLYRKKDNEPAAVHYLRAAVTILCRHFPDDTENKGTALNNLALVLRETRLFERVRTETFGRLARISEP